MRNAPDPSANISLRPWAVRTSTGPERVGAMVDGTGAIDIRAAIFCCRRSISCARARGIRCSSCTTTANSSP